MTAGLGKKKPHRYRDWHLARAKVDREGHCRNCGLTGHLEAAHIVGREHDDTVVEPDRIIPLCYRCHQGVISVHAKRVDLLPLLTLDEQLQAVADAGGIGPAYSLLMPSLNPKRVA